MNPLVVLKQDTLHFKVLGYRKCQTQNLVLLRGIPVFSFHARDIAFRLQYGRAILVKDTHVGVPK